MVRNGDKRQFPGPWYQFEVVKPCHRVLKFNGKKIKVNIKRITLELLQTLTVMQKELKKLVCLTSNACFKKSTLSDPSSSTAILSRDPSGIISRSSEEIQFLLWGKTGLNLHAVVKKFYS